MTLLRQGSAGQGHPGRVTVEAWEAAAMIAGTMTQKRVGGRAYFWKVGQLRWVQEPFTEYVAKKHPAMTGIVYHADHEGQSLVGFPERLNNIQCRTLVKDARSMGRTSSRLTIEIISVEPGRDGRDFRPGDEEAEGLDMMRAWNPAGAEVWRRVWPLHELMTVIRFNVIKEPIGKILVAREAA